MEIYAIHLSVSILKTVQKFSGFVIEAFRTLHIDLQSAAHKLSRNICFLTKVTENISVTGFIHVID